MLDRLVVMMSAALAMAIALPSTAIHAARIPGAAEPTSAVAGSDTDGGTMADAAEIAVFRKASLPLRDAMHIAERSQKGSRAVDVSFDGSTGRPTYRVTITHGHTVWNTVVDGTSGRIEKQEAPFMVHDMPSADRAVLVSFGEVSARLAQAVEIAERRADGKAVGGGLSLENKELSFVVAVLSGDEIKVVVLQPPQVKSNPER